MTNEEAKLIDALATELRSMPNELDQGANLYIQQKIWPVTNGTYKLVQCVLMQRQAIETLQAQLAPKPQQSFLGAMKDKLFSSPPIMPAQQPQAMAYTSQQLALNTPSGAYIPPMQYGSSGSSFLGSTDEFLTGLTTQMIDRMVIDGVKAWTGGNNGDNNFERTEKDCDSSSYKSGDDFNNSNSNGTANNV